MIIFNRQFDNFGKCKRKEQIKYICSCCFSCFTILNSR
nr:MAG TPA: hypothetical protein [Caudoviricetes sp.]